jgi:hypothetical protein
MRWLRLRLYYGLLLSFITCTCLLWLSCLVYSIVTRWNDLLSIMLEPHQTRLHYKDVMHVGLVQRICDFLSLLVSWLG